MFAKTAIFMSNKSFLFLPGIFVWFFEESTALQHSLSLHSYSKVPPMSYYNKEMREQDIPKHSIGICNL